MRQLATRIAIVPLALALALLATTPAGAQAFAQRAKASRDSFATRVMYNVLLHELTEFVAQGLYDTTTQPFTITLPNDSAGIGWQDIRRALTAALRARPAAEGDSTRAHVTVLHVEYTAQKVRFEFDIGAYRRCGQGKAWQGSNTTYRFEAAWDQLTWPYRGKSIMVGDLFGCDIPFERAR